MPHPSLHSVAHRPWPLPEREWSLTMRWQDLLFLHWPVDAAQLRPFVPPGLQLETFDGSAWLGVVPFVMTQTRFRWLPKVPTAHHFPECNLRTYVRGGDRSGVWFFSLDAASRLAVEGARLGFGLPYFAARMACHRRGERVTYRSERRDRRGPSATFVGDWAARGEHRVAVPGSLEHWLVERYCLFAMRRGRLVCGEIHHEPWRLASVDLELGQCDMTRLVGTELQGPPVSALAALPIDVAAWSPRAC